MSLGEGLAFEGAGGLVIYVLAGALATVLTQSSSAAIAVVLTAASGGVLNMDAAAAMVIGANLGTTSTAALAVIGATANARRVAAAHVVFNLAAGSAALVLLPLLLWFVSWTGQALRLEQNPAVALALFHTTFNLLGLALMWGVTDRLAGWLSNRFTTAGETLARPVYLDRNVAVTPALALDALRLELERMATISRSHALSALNAGDRSAELSEQHRALMSLADTVETFVTGLERERLPADLTGQLPGVLRMGAYIEEVANLPDEYELLRKRWHDLKAVLLSAAARNALLVSGLNVAIERLRACLRIAEQSVKFATQIQRLRKPENSPV